MELNTFLLACKEISDQARRELVRAGCTIHRDVPGLDDDIEIVELRYEGDSDLNMMSIWGTPREIQIFSRNLYLFSVFDEKIEGYKLEGGKFVEEEPKPEPVVQELEYDGDLGDLEGFVF